MKLRRFLYLQVFCLLTVLCLLAACKDREEPEPTKTELLSKDWLWIKATANGSSFTPQNLAGMLFKADGTYIIKSKTGSNSSGTWAFNSTEQKIILDGNIEFTIITLNQTTLIYEFESFNYKNGIVVTRYEFKPV